MKKIIAIFLFSSLLSCSMQEEYVTCENGYGYLYKNDKEIVCPFYIQKGIAITDSNGIKKNLWIDYEGGVTVLDSNVDEYFPLKRRNSPYTYKIKISGLKKYFTEEQYTVNLWTADDNFRACGESREFTFYKVAESIDSVEYVSRRNRDGQYLFFAQKEMPSYDWYHVLKVCDKRQYLIGEIKE